jgi:hypothetical protein
MSVVTGGQCGAWILKLDNYGSIPPVVTPTHYAVRASMHGKVGSKVVFLTLLLYSRDKFWAGADSTPSAAWHHVRLNEAKGQIELSK